MKLDQKLVSGALSGYFGVVFMIAAPQLSFGSMLTYSAISMALGYGITALSKAFGELVPDVTPVPGTNSDAPPPYDDSQGSSNTNAPSPSISISLDPAPRSRPAVIINRRPPTQSVFVSTWGPFGGTRERVVERHIEPSRPAFVPPHIPMPSAPPLFASVPPPVATTVSRPALPPKPAAREVERHIEPSRAVPVTFSNPSAKPPARVVERHVEPSITQTASAPAAGMPPKPAPRVVAHSIQPS